MDDSVLRVEDALTRMTRSRLRWLLHSGRWQRVHPRVVVTHSGGLSREEQLLAALSHVGAGAALGRETAAALDGLTGFDHRLIHVVAPRGSRAAPRPGLRVHPVRTLCELDVHPARRPRRTRLERSVVDIARAPDLPEHRARAVLAAAVQQRLVRPEDLLEVVSRLRNVRRAALIRATLPDVADGAHSLPELQFAVLLRRAGLPRPKRQTVRSAGGRRRYLDAEWPRWRLAVEVDGGQHLAAQAWWDDLDRQNEITVTGTRLLRFPAWVVRERPEEVARTIRRALERGGWRPAATEARAGRG